MEEVFEDIDHLPTNEPLPDNGPILQSLLMTEEELKINLMKTCLDDEDEVWIKAKTSISQELVHKTIDDKAKVELPEVYAKYRTVFKKEASERMPEHKPWDHAIDLKPDFIPKDCKINLSLITRRTKGTRQVPGRKPQKRVYQTLEITNGITFLLCLQKRLKETETMSRL